MNIKLRVSQEYFNTLVMDRGILFTQYFTNLVNNIWTDEYGQADRNINISNLSCEVSDRFDITINDIIWAKKILKECIFNSHFIK